MARLRKPTRKEWFKPIDKALWSIPYYGDMDDEVLGEVEEWLDALTSAVTEAAEVEDGAEALGDLLDEVAEVFDVQMLLEIKPDIEKLYEYGSAFSYGICVLSKKKLAHAEECLLNVQGTFEEFLAGLK